MFAHRPKTTGLYPIPIQLNIILVLGLMLPGLGLAKMYEEPKSFSLQDISSLERVEPKTLPKVDTDKLLKEDREQKKTGSSEPPRVAAIAKVAFTLADFSSEDKISDGRLWRLRIHSPGAKNQSLGITRFDMPQQAKLWIYNPQRKHVGGPYTSTDRSSKGRLWTPLIEGDELVVEVFAPIEADQPVIEIRDVNQGYRGFDQDGVTGGVEGLCNIDVICPEGNAWQNQIHAVGAYTYETAFGLRYCTGTMLNNTAYDHKNYFLTAHHCSVTTSNDDSVVVYWNFESPTCGTHTAGPKSQTQTGSTLRAAYAATDFRLLELSTSPDPAFNVRYAGWDISTTTPVTSVGIHHPRGDVKAISVSNSAAQSYNYVLSAGDPGVLNAMGNHWGVTWDSMKGTTEEGSSGSCLFDPNGRCRGQLHGAFPGGCSPSTPTNNNGTRSYYGKFSVSWEGGGTQDTRLRDWLDPAGILTGGIAGIDGDPHITTTNRMRYDFQAAGEFVALRDPNGLEIQTRQTPVPTANIVADTHSELPVCVSVNTAVAARVGGHRVSYQPKPGSAPNPNPNNLELYIDGSPATVGPNGLDLIGGGRIAKTSVPGGLELDFPDGSALFTTPNWWGGPNIWYFNNSLTRPPAIDGTDADSFPIGGIAGAIESNDWLPRLPDGSSMGPRPTDLQERYVDLYQKFADAWRVTDKSSLFTYGHGASTENFTLRNWPPPLHSPCTIPQGQAQGAPTLVPVKPVPLETAKKACSGIKDEHARQNCIFDTQVTGNLGFARVYRFSERVVEKSTRTTVNYDKVRAGSKELVIFTATVVQARADGKDIATGVVQFMVDGRKVSKPIPLDKNGRAIWKTSKLRFGKHDVSASYIPALDRKKRFFSSISTVAIHNGDRD